MFSNTPNQAQQPRGAVSNDGLEQRLRGLILNNATANNTNTNMSPIPSTPTDVPHLPPHMLMASPADQRQYLENMAARVSQVQHAPNTANDSSQGGRKRMNQSQRRQMNSQLSIPVNTRQNHQPGSSQGFTPHSGHHQPTWSPPSYNNSPQYQNSQKYQHREPYSPRFPHPSPASPYFSQMSYQNSPSSGVHSNQISPNYQSHTPAWQNINPTSPGPNSFTGRPTPQNRQLYHPGSSGGQGGWKTSTPNPEAFALQSAHLDELTQAIVSQVEIDEDEATKKEKFRCLIEKICQEAILEHEQQELGNESFDATSVHLKCYGSLSSGFATKGSDMDLALLTPFSNPSAESPESPIPRLLEKKLLSLGYGARLLTKTRIPIIKLCELPTEKLMSDLLVERTKWENDFVEEHDDHLEGKHAGSPAEEHSDPSLKLNKSKATMTPETSHAKVASQTIESSPIVLKQKEHQHLMDYYNCAKRTLRKHGGRDLSVNSAELSIDESKLLNDVCRAFILGLSSKELSDRLISYHSISPLFNTSVPFVQRSLNGICTQIEGERLAMGWEKRPLLEATDKHESECCEILESWMSLQNKYGQHTQSEIYNRQLYNASEKLKKITSLQLVFLEQMQYENPQDYCARVQHLKDDLEGKNQPKSLLREPILSGEAMTALFIQRYIAGIHNPQFREELQPLQDIKTLKEVARRHQILQLANDYEHAIEVHLYDDNDEPHIKQYIAGLRNLVKNEPFGNAAALIAHVRTLPDPTQISLSKPRDRYKDHLEFPKNTVGIQCDINFSNHLALHNTLLLRLYSLCDPRIKDMVLFVKHWAKTRGINTPYRGTLGSYGYVLMVLHYLINVVRPPVCPNLQHAYKPIPDLSPAEQKAQTICDGRDVKFWRDEVEIRSLAERKRLTQNEDSVGLLLRGFFEYFAQSGQLTTVPGVRGFDWGREVLSLRSQNGIISKQEKGWVGARTVVETTQIAAPPTPSTPAFTPVTPAAISDQNAQTESSEADIKPAKQPPKTIEETKEIRHRYLFAIEDPFEIDHNIARTVAHPGIVLIRDEFRRAWGIVRSIGTRYTSKEELLQPIPGPKDSKEALQKLLDIIHKPDAKEETVKPF